MAYRYRYTLITKKQAATDANGAPTSYSYTLLLRDDGYRVHFMIVAPEENSEVGKWELWAEYKQCDLPGPAAMIADHLMDRTAED